MSLSLPGRNPPGITVRFGSWVTVGSMGGAVRTVGVLMGLALLAGTAHQVSPPSAVASAPAVVPGRIQASGLAVLLPSGAAAPSDGASSPSDGSGGPPASGPESPDCSKLKCVALTMDDGPVPQTAKLLKLLRKEHAHATFFVLGMNAKRHPAIVRQMVADGNAVGNHSWDHPQFWKASKKKVRRELARTDKLLKKLTGSRPVLVRAPFGEVDGRVRAITKSRGQVLVQWSVDPVDWRDRNTRVVTKRILKQARRNSIILSHDIRPTTRKAYAGIIRGLKARGFTLVTVPELLGTRAKPGHLYFHG